MSLQVEFDRFAGDYRRIHDNNLTAIGYSSSYFAERKVREIHARVKSCHLALRILDLGCGDGLCTDFFKTSFPNSAIYGLDVSAKTIFTAQKKGVSDTIFGIFDGRQIPFLTGTFNIIMLANVLHHIDTVEKQVSVLKECRRVLKTEGILFIFEHNPLNPITRRLVRHCLFDADARLILHTQMKRLLRRLHFDVKCRFIMFFPGFLAGLDFLEKFLWWAPIGGQYYAVCTKAHPQDYSV